MSRTIVPVVGMHRSGTSALAGALHSGGVAMGSERHFRPKPLPENPKGFYEDYRFRRINDLLCEGSGYRVKSWGSPPSKVEDSPVLLARRFVLVLRRGAHRSSSWGWKDPRTCLTFDLWASTLRLVGRLDDVHAVFIVRDPRAVSDSLGRRDGLAPEQALDLWREYNVRVLRSLEASRVPVSVVEFSRFLSDPLPVVEKLATHITGFDAGAGARFVDLRHGRSSSDVSDVPEREGRRYHSAMQLFEELRSRAI
jgi:O-antigen biosynthesis protein